MKTAQRWIWSIGLISVFMLFSAPPAHAGVIDRIKDIYNAPGRIDEIQQQYEDAQDKLKEQQDKLAEAERNAESLAEQQQQLLQNNESLAKQNAELSERLLQMEKSRAEQERLKSRIFSIVGTALLLVAVYFAALRIWRYAVWRRQRRMAGRTQL